MIFPVEFGVQVSEKRARRRKEREMEGESEGVREREQRERKWRGSVHGASQHVVHIRVRLGLMKARLILGCEL